MTTGPRIEAVAPPYHRDVAAELAAWMPPAAPVDPLRLFRTLCVNLPLAQAMRPLGSFQLSRQADSPSSSLPIRTRELVILRTCAQLGAEYEWGVHATAFGAAAQLSNAELALTASGTSSDFGDPDRQTIDLVDQLVGQRTVSEATWYDLQPHFTEQQLLELLVLCGWYHIISFVVNATEMPSEEWAASFAESRGAERV